ncbi:MAG: tripartite tricarboxylate transporter substrate binding protein [Betaproteobacteria bacterium]|nr:tripartite tricarboxylate transporter substrate binding protein [Betaproteobacteria bacterium]MBI2961971.1 tripartite tricarboxylate transporter substrate binding protein [Betaproteobacteria bacterium]
MRAIAIRVGAGLFAAAVAMAAQASWPERLVTIVVPFPAGGTGDSVGRLTAEWLTKGLKQKFVVENRAGATGTIAAEFVARAPADGYTLFLASAGVMEIVPHMQKVRYDTFKSFAPISVVGSNAQALAANPNFPVKTLTELVAHAKERSVQVPYASGGAGTLAHLTMVLLLKRAGIAMSHVAYKGNAPALTDVLGGHVPLYIGGVYETLLHHKNGKIRVIAVSTDKRVGQLPEVPTVAEQGYPGFSTATWNGLMAPAGTPKDVISIVANALRPACQDAGFSAKLEATGVDAMCNSPEQFADMLKANWLMWQEAVKAAGVAAQ